MIFLIDLVSLGNVKKRVIGLLSEQAIFDYLITRDNPIID